MCDHIHTVAMLAGAPGDEWVEPMLRRETFGLDEALLRLARINYKERLEKMLPLVDEFVALVKVNEKKNSFMRLFIALVSLASDEYGFLARTDPSKLFIVCN